MGQLESKSIDWKRLYYTGGTQDYIRYMLDDLTLIHHRDTQDALGAVERQSQQLAGQFELPNDPDRAEKQTPIRSVVFLAMGDSALGGMIAKSWLELNVPFEVVRGYDLPSYVNPETLCIIVSYPDDMNETVSVLEQAQARQAQIVQIPAVAQSSFAVWSVVRIATTIVEVYGLAQHKTAELEAQQAWFTEQIARWRPEVSTSKNEAKQIALELAGKSVVIQSGAQLWPAAHSWKYAINENAKQIAWTSQYPEAGYNEFLGWTRQPVHKPYAIVELRSRLERPQIQKYFEVSDRLLSGIRPTPITVDVQGDTLLRQLLYTSALGDFVSVYVALLGGIDPSASQALDKLKKELR